ncbi:hypothetical protein G3489_14465 [Shewanella baltica]|uniref:hypothetical protein n=4 Tax=Shewanella baltica TaxID=62322 RepID=UPI00217E12E9|nr:hypothetical protein [Shewanella baltica]MCS6270892.1 hypothetical protein [Shewanella baltica]
MIINQSIRSGFVTVNKTGAYFSLISAGGVVNVRLSEKGRTVLDTKMWVGMSIDKAIPFDEITIKGDDGAVEFWAGDVSMSHAVFANGAAKAIRTNVKYINGESKIVDSDITRTAVRIRSDKDVFIGGAAFFSGGWRVAANQVEEIPVAGILSAYKPAGYLDYSVLDDVGNLDSFWPTNSGQSECYVSDDEQKRIIKTTETGVGNLLVTVDGGVEWNITLTNVRAYAFDPRTGIHYAYRTSSGNNFAHFLKSSDGINWGDLFIGYLTGMGNLTQSTTLNNIHLVGKHFQYMYFGYIVCCDIETGQVKVKVLNKDSNNMNYGCFIDDDLKVGFFGGSFDSNTLFKTEDGGITWKDVGIRAKYSSFSAASMGKNLFYIDNTSGKPVLSDDFGETWISSSGGGWDITKNIPVNLFGNIWVTHEGGLFKLVNIENELVVSVALGTAGINMNSKNIFFNPKTGRLYTSAVNNNISKSIGVSVYGDITYARVEVMELLS